MNAPEMSDLMDVLYNNITSNQAPGLTEYEKSIFLTKGQDELLKNYFNPSGNKYQSGFDDNPKRQIDFSTITSVSTVSTFAVSNYDKRSNSKSADLPTDIWMIINEKVNVTRDGSSIGLIVRPISFEEYDRLMSKPYKRPLKYQAWRLINNVTANKADLIVGPNDVVASYDIRYVRKPKPVIVGPLDGLTIDGYCFTGDGTAGATATEGCELDPILHEEIVQRAVELAKIAWTATGQDNSNMMIQAGQRSE